MQMQSQPQSQPMSAPGKRTVSLALALILLIVGIGAGAGVTYVSLLAGGSFNSGLCSSGRTLTIGMLTDLSSDLASQGTRARDAAQLAIMDINSYLSSPQGAATTGTIACNVKFAVSVTDYALDGAKALSALQTFASAGVQVVVGPLNSGAAQNILQYANSNHIVLISPSSTSLALAIPNDYLFRTAPNDRVQGLADARMIIDRGASALIIVQRHDSYGNFLANATAQRFKALGGHVIDIIPYDTLTTDFTPVLATLYNDFQTANSTYPNRVAMDFVSFEELAQIITQVEQQHPSLLNDKLPWFGTDGEAQDTFLSGDPIAGPLLAKVR